MTLKICTNSGRRTRARATNPLLRFFEEQRKSGVALTAYLIDGKRRIMVRICRVFLTGTGLLMAQVSQIQTDAVRGAWKVRRLLYRISQLVPTPDLSSLMRGLVWPQMA